MLNDSLDELIQTRVVDYPNQGPGTRQLNNASPLSLKDIYAVNVPFYPLFTPKSKSSKVIFGQNLPKYQAYSLTFWPKLAHFTHFSLLNQNLGK